MIGFHLQPYDKCPIWKHQQNYNKEGSEYKKFEHTDMFQELVNDVSMRLGFKTPLEISKITDIFDQCRFDQAWNLDTSSPWCVVS